MFETCYFFFGDLGFAAAFFAFEVFALVAFDFFTFETTFLGFAAAGLAALAVDFLAAIAIG